MTVSTGSVKVPGTTKTQARDAYITKQSIYQVSTSQYHRLGERLSIGDGRVFHYAKNVGTAITAGVLCQGAALVATDRDVAIAAAGSIGDMSISITTGTALTANQYAEGYIYLDDAVNTSSGVYKIASHLLAASSGLTCVINLYDPLWKAITKTSGYATLIKNPWDSVVTTPNATVTQIVVGVPICDVPLGSTTPQYFWMQTWGPCPVICVASTVVGNRVIPAATAGSVGPSAVATLADIGTVMVIGSGTTFDLIFLMISA